MGHPVTCGIDINRPKAGNGGRGGGAALRVHDAHGPGQCERLRVGIVAVGVGIVHLGSTSKIQALSSVTLLITRTLASPEHSLYITLNLASEGARPRGRPASFSTPPSIRPFIDHISAAVADSDLRSGERRRTMTTSAVLSRAAPPNETETNPHSPKAIGDRRR